MNEIRHIIVNKQYRSVIEQYRIVGINIQNSHLSIARKGNLDTDSYFCSEALG